MNQTVQTPTVCEAVLWPALWMAARKSMSKLLLVHSCSDEWEKCCVTCMAYTAARTWRNFEVKDQQNRCQSCYFTGKSAICQRFCVTFPCEVPEVEGRFWAALLCGVWPHAERPTAQLTWPDRRHLILSQGCWETDGANRKRGREIRHYENTGKGNKGTAECESSSVIGQTSAADFSKFFWCRTSKRSRSLDTHLNTCS